MAGTSIPSVSDYSEGFESSSGASRSKPRRQSKTMKPIRMVREALGALRNPKGASLKDIVHYVQNKYSGVIGVDSKRLTKSLKMAVRRGVLRNMLDLSRSGMVKMAPEVSRRSRAAHSLSMERRRRRRKGGKKGKKGKKCKKCKKGRKGKGRRRRRRRGRRGKKGKKGRK